MVDSIENSKRIRTVSRRSSVDEESDTLDVLQILKRQRWLIMLLTLTGLAAGIAYGLNAQVWYESQAKVLINQKGAGMGQDPVGSDVVDEDILANHIELLRSRMIVGEALRDAELLEMASIQPHLSAEEDAVDYVIDHLEVVKGGEGGATTARSLNITFTHTDPKDVETVLTAVLARYEQFIVDQLEQVMGRANELVQKAKEEVEADLVAAEEEHLQARQAAPLFFQGEGSSNVYQDRYRSLQDELLQVEIKESTVRTRLERVSETLHEIEESGDPIDHLDKLALIDSESLERLGVFAGLQMNAAESPEFKAAMPAKMEQARAQITHLLALNSEEQRLTAVFGSGHPRVQDIRSEIETVKEFLRENEGLTESTSAFNSTLSPEGLLTAYIGFLNHDLAALKQRKNELMILAADAESNAKELIEYELEDLVLQKKIERQQALFDGVVHQLLELDTANALNGYLYEFIELPRFGEQTWPNLPITALGGLMLGLFSGLLLGFANDVRDGRFRSAAEIDDAIGLVNLGMVERLNSPRRGVKGLLAAEASPNAETFRLGRTMLLPEIRAGRLRTIGFTSPMQGDGKSTVVSNFAVSFAQIGLKVLLIDADLRRPSAHRYLSVPQQDGLSDVLQGDLEWTDVIKSTDAEGVFVVTAGSSTKAAAELLQSDRLDELLTLAKEEFDVVLVDLPPVLAVSDPVVVLPRLDGGVLVVRVARVRRDEVLNTMRRVDAASGKLVGCILNAFGAGKKFDSAGGYFGYYRSDYSRPSGKRVTPSKPRGAAAQPVGQNNGSTH